MNSIIAKVKQAKALQNQQQPVDPIDLIGKPPPVPTKRPVPTRSNRGKTRTRGRPRVSLARKELELRPIEKWLHACLQPKPECMEYIGELRTRYAVTTTGQKVKIRAEYIRPTLSESYLDYCRSNGYQARLPKTFAGLILETALGFGWDCRLSRSFDLRRATISGLCLVGQMAFDGEDRRYGADDRKRWLPKPK
jgi:hypothetical protein